MCYIKVHVVCLRIWKYHSFYSNFELFFCHFVFLFRDIQKPSLKTTPLGLTPGCQQTWVGGTVYNKLRSWKCQLLVTCIYYYPVNCVLLKFCERYFNIFILCLGGQERDTTSLFPPFLCWYKKIETLSFFSIWSKF